jgi:DNA-binding MarR family transcriptional regulator
VDTVEFGHNSAPRIGAAFLLAQVGAHAAGLFAERVSELDLTPAQAGLLRLLAMNPGRSQRELAGDLGMPPSRFVQFADELEKRGLIERRKNLEDRRLHALHLTDEGFGLLGKLRAAGMQHEKLVCEGLSESEHQTLIELLGRIARQRGLGDGIHPGYRKI